jgi:hypothetical protein
VVLATVPYDPQGGEAVYREGIDEHNRILRELAAANGFVLADVGRARPACSPAARTASSSTSST